MWSALVVIFAQASAFQHGHHLGVARHSPASRAGVRALIPSEGEEVEVPRHLDEVCDRCRQALRTSLAAGKRGLRVEAGVPSLDVGSRAYEPAMLARFTLELAQALTVLEGPLLVLFPGVNAVTEARKLIDAGGDFWPEAERERLQVSALTLYGPPRPDELDWQPPAAVMIAGLTPVGSSDDTTLGHARAWLQFSAVSSCIAVCLNPRTRLLPPELTRFETAFALVPYTVARQPAPGEEACSGEDAGRALLWRAYPEGWRVLFDAGSSGEYTVLATLDRQPDEAELSELLLPTVTKRRAALDSLRGLQP